MSIDIREAFPFAIRERTDCAADRMLPRPELTPGTLVSGTLDAIPPVTAPAPVLTARLLALKVYLVRFLGQPLVRLAFAKRTRRSRRGVLWIPNMSVDATQAPFATHLNRSEEPLGSLATKERTAIS